MRVAIKVSNLHTGTEGEKGEEVGCECVREERVRRWDVSV